MANFVSPGVYIIEKDVSDYTPALNPTVVGIVGFASKGKPNKATLITSQENLIKTFGAPSESLPGQGIEGTLEILETCNQLYYVRALDTGSAADASAQVQVGACPAVALVASSIGVDNAAYLTVQVKNNAGVNQYASAKKFAITAGTTFGSPATAATTQEQAVGMVVGGSMDDSKSGSYMQSSAIDSTIVSSVGNFIVGNVAGKDATLEIHAYSDAAYSIPAPIILPLDTSGAASGVSSLAGGLPVSNLGFVSALVNGYTYLPGASTSGLGYLTESLYEGVGYNLSTLADGTIVGNSITVEDLGNRNNNLLVNDAGAVEEGFKVSLVASGAFIEEAINTGETNLKSQTIKGNLYENGVDFTAAGAVAYTDKVSALGVSKVGALGGGWTAGNPTGAVRIQPAATGLTTIHVQPRFNKLVAGTYGLSAGTNGVGTSTSEENAALIGVTAPTRTGMQLLNDDVIPVTMAAIPGITAESVQAALLTLAETTGDFLAVFGTPLGIGGVQDAIDYHNGLTPYRSAPLNSSYAALYFPQVKIFQPNLAKDIWMDPAVFAIRQMGHTDSVSELWFAPAGFVRGRLSKATEVEYAINRGDRDSMYSGGNAVNPIVNFPQQGITIWGQRTLQRSPTALDRINVRRLMLFVKATIEASTKRFVFEPNDKITQERITDLLQPFFADVQARRGIKEFKVICDESVNTPVRVDRNELWCKVMIKPTKAAEVLIFELNITSQSATL